MRKEWAFAPDLEKRKAISEALSRRAYEVVPYVPFAQWSYPVAAVGDRLSGVVPVASVPVMWNIEKK